MTTKMGSQTMVFPTKPVLIGHGTVGGPKEGQGPVGSYLDKIYPDLTMKEKSFEKAEQLMMSTAIDIALEKSSLAKDKVGFFVAGDLLNQITTSGISARKLGAPYWGLFGACSTFSMGLSLASLLVDSGAAENVVAATSSHNSTAERQYRYPTEYGAQLPPWAQHTVTGAAATVICSSGSGPTIELATTGKVMDLGIMDPFNMGSAMAPAAASTIFAHMEDTQRQPSDYDLIVTGDLGQVGREILVELAQRQGYDLSENYRDCGELIYSKGQKENAGASGCACCALVTLGLLFNQNYRRILVVATGALHSPTTSQQGDSMPTVSHAVSIEFPAGGGN